MSDRIPFQGEILPLSAYKALEPDRLSETELENGQLLQLMMLCKGLGIEAMRSPVYVQHLERSLGSTTLEVVFTDEDLRPVTRAYPSLMVTNYWKPRPAISLLLEEHAGASYAGYFIPYQDELSDELQAVAEELLVPVHASHHQEYGQRA